MAGWLTFFIVLSIFVTVLWRKRARSRLQVGQRRVRSPFQSVAIKCKMDACDAVTKLNGQRFIGSEAPSFPLPECDARQCSCRYEFHGDRRDVERRLLSGTNHSFIVTYTGEDKREQDDRRGE